MTTPERVPETAANVAPPGDAHRRPVVFRAALLVLAAIAWWFVYRGLEPFAKWFTYTSLGLAGGHLASAVEFFVFEAPRVMMLLTLVVFGVGIIRSFFTPERTRAILAGRRDGLFGWKVAALYMGTGLLIAMLAGWIIGRLRLERWVEGWVYQMRPGVGPGESAAKPTWGDRAVAGREAVKDIVGKVWPYVLGGIAVGAGIHGYVPQDFMASIVGKDAWWSVPVAVLLGIPMYSNAAGIIPIVQALLGKGAALGTVLAFMMAVIGYRYPR